LVLAYGLSAYFSNFFAAKNDTNGNWATWSSTN
jgi:hypothetical protein